MMRSRRILSLLLAVLLCACLAPAAAFAAENAAPAYDLSLYIPAVEKAASDKAYDGEGMVYDLDGDGVPELLLLYSRWSDGDFVYPEGVFSVCDIESGGCVYRLEELELEPMVGAAGHIAGVVSYQDSPYVLVQYSSYSDESGSQTYELRDVEDLSVQFRYRCRVEDYKENFGAARYDYSRNGESCPEDEFRTFTESIEGVDLLGSDAEAQYGEEAVHSAMPLDELAAQLAAAEAAPATGAAAPAAQPSEEDPGWVVVNGVRRYIDPDGNMAIGWKVISGKTYYFKSDGSMHTGWANLNGKRFFFLPSTGVMVTGWAELSDGQFYFDPDGVMATGWRRLDGETYYFDDDGAIHTGWARIDGQTYFFTPSSGAMVTGWANLNGKKYFFMPYTGIMITGSVTIDGKTYQFDKNGVCLNP